MATSVGSDRGEPHVRYRRHNVGWIPFPFIFLMPQKKRRFIRLYRCVIVRLMAGFLRKKEYAPGIPEKGKYAPLPIVADSPREMEFVIQSHEARRAGKHLDLRIGDPDSGRAYSWALRKIPPPGEGTYAIEQQLHTIPYMDWEGEIPSGYGAGTVRKLRREKAEVLASSPKEIRFNLYSGRVPEQFVLKNLGGGVGRKWVLRNVTPARTTGKWSRLVPDTKPSVKEVPISSVDPSAADQVIQPKIDGAHAIMVLEGGRPVKVFSYRNAKNETGLIEHTFRMPGFDKNIAPEGLKPTVIRGEIYALKDGRPLPAHEVGALLNASVARSREMQRQGETPLRFVGFEVLRHEGKLLRDSIPYDVHLKVLRDLAERIPMLEVMPTALTTSEKKRLMREIASGTHGLTREGLIARSRATSKALKAKLISDHDVYVRAIYPSEHKGHAGGFTFSWTPKGDIVGRVGSGFSHKLREDMLKNPRRYLGRVAKVKAQEVYPSGAMRAPVFRAFHETKGPQPYHELPE